MKVLIIGNGFIAGAIIRNLELQGFEVLVFSRSAKVEIQCRQIVGDIFDFSEFIRVLEWKPQIIIHTAWVTAHSRYTEDPSNFAYADFTIKLAEYISNSDVKHFIVLGTRAEYGYQVSASTAGVTELNPTSLYAKQKAFTFNSVKNILEGSNVRFSWVRIFQPYGPKQDHKRLLPYLIDSIRSRKEINLRDTTTAHDWISTRDIASAVVWILNNELPIELDIGTSFGYTNLELLQVLGNLLGNSFQWRQIGEQDFTNRQVSVMGKDSPILARGWRPKDDLVQGLAWVLKE